MRTKLPSGVGLLALAADGKASLILYVSKDLHAKYTRARPHQGRAAPHRRLRRGRPDLGQAGGTAPENIPAALAKLKELV